MGSFALMGKQGGSRGTGAGQRVHAMEYMRQQGWWMIQIFFNVVKTSELLRAAGSLLVHRDCDKVESNFIKVEKLSVTQLQTQDNDKKAQEIWNGL